MPQRTMIPLKQVKADTYSSDFYLVERDLLFFNRSHYWPEATSEIDVFGRFWSLAFADLPQGSLMVGRGGVRIPFDGVWFFFLPPFSIVEWCLAQGPFHWQAFISQLPLPEGLPHEPIAFRSNEVVYPDPQSIIEIVRSARDPVAIGKEETKSRLAARTKAYIDQHFNSECRLSEAARELAVNHAKMTRSFNEAYGISPVVYRNKLRVFESLRCLMMANMSVASAAEAVGFSDISRFHKQFRREMRTVATNFKLNRTKP